MGPDEDFQNDESSSPAGNLKKKIIIISVTVVIQIVVSFLLITTVLDKPISLDQLSKQPAEEAEGATDETEKSIGEIFLIEDLVINPAGTQGRRFVALSIGLEIVNGANIDNLKKRKPALSDIIISLLAQKSHYEFIEVENRANLRQEIFDALVKNLPANTINHIYITKFILQ